jgi:hypothetical protein
MKKIFLFKDILAEHVKVSHGGFVGLPSITGLTGLNRNFCIQLAKQLGLSPDSFQPAGALLAIEGYHLHEGYKKGHKGKQAVYEAIPAAWASFTAHIALEVETTNDRAEELLAGEGLSIIAKELLEGMSLCKGSLRNVKQPVNLARFASESRTTERACAMHLLPSQSAIIRDCSYLVADLRSENIPLMEGLVAATVRHSKRPIRYRQFFEDESRNAQDWRLAPVMNGALLLQDAPTGKSVRPDSYGQFSASTVASPTFTLTRLQKTPSVRAVQDPEQHCCFWREYASPRGYFCHAS